MTDDAQWTKNGNIVQKAIRSTFFEKNPHSSDPFRNAPFKFFFTKLDFETNSACRNKENQTRDKNSFYFDYLISN